MSLNTSDWKQLEQDIARLLKEDNAKLTPGSGNSKSEEDVVGDNIICQCKYTTNTNAVILKKDLDRLLNASKLLDKFPIFVNRNETESILSIPITQSTIGIIELIIKTIIIHNQLKYIEKFIANNKLNINIIKKLDKELHKINKLIKELYMANLSSFEKVDNNITWLLRDAMNCNLFDGEPNGQ